MSKRLIVVLALALVVGLTMSAYAEVQNVKISGDLAITGAARNNFDLIRKSKTGPNEDHENMWLSQVRVRMDADLTDNVAATVRLINERNWDVESVANTDIDLDLAYVSLKEFLYSPLSLTLGRQEIKFGNALIMGNARTSTASLNGVPSDLSLRKAFDALKATLNYDPLIIDAFFAKIDESNNKTNDDIDLYGINASYDFSKKLKADVYLYDKINHGNIWRSNIKTIGTLITATPIENLKTSLEAALQFGSQERTDEKRMKAWATQAMADYTFSKVKFTPALGATYTYLSGDGNSTDKTNKAWNSMYYDQALNNITYAILPFSNMQVLNLRGSVKPTEDTAIMLNYGTYRRNKNSGTLTSTNVDGQGNTYSYAMTTQKYLGYELDLTGTYNYTEDVQFGLTFGYFKPGKAFAAQNRRDATQCLGSMKVVF
jgi:hypothetical protein